MTTMSEQLVKDINLINKHSQNDIKNKQTKIKYKQMLEEKNEEISKLLKQMKILKTNNSLEDGQDGITKKSLKE